MKLDTVDLAILRILQEDSRSPILDIAKVTGVSRPTVKARIERLKQAGIVKKFTIIVDRDAILENILLIVRMKADDIEDVLMALREMEEVLEVYQVMGERNIACKAAVRNMGEVKALMERIGRLPVRDLEPSIVLRTYKEEYETKIGPEIGISMDCEYCGKRIHGDPVKFTLHNQEHYFCCNTCLKGYRRKLELVAKAGK
ncbi:MAG: winged helix-turn-helix transcriptional regulator [Candidatus Hydrothermarchaeota archaeon]